MLAQTLVAPAIEAALARYEAAVLAPAIAAGTQPGDGSAPPPANPALEGGTMWAAQQYVLAPDGASPFAAVVTVTPTASSVPACVASGGSTGAGADVERNGQCSAFVQESRLSLTIVADAFSKSAADKIKAAGGTLVVTPSTIE